MITGMQTHHTTVETQIKQSPEYSQREYSFKGAIKTALTKDNTGEARGVSTDRTERNKREARRVCTGR